MPFSDQKQLSPRVYDFNQHQIDEALIDPDALFVVNRLRSAGFSTYLVGGSVRDLLLRKTPKDFDVSTSALPEDVKRIFGRSCLLIGRRFRLAHVRFGHKVIEVSTFRSGEMDNDLIIQDNKWGTEVEDVLRRDFTINGLFYDPQNHTVIDHVGGWEDIQGRLLKTIGDPMVRFKQDPVRMIRMLKFQARLGFAINEPCLAALKRCTDEITKSAPARVLEEIFRMLESGYSSQFFRLITDHGILDLIFPCLSHFLTNKYGYEVFSYLDKADHVNRQDLKRPLDRAVLTSCLIFPILEREIETQYLLKNKAPHIGEIMQLTDALIDAVVITSFSHFPRRMSASLAFILTTQYRMTPLSGKKHHKPKLLQNKEFHLAMQFFRLRTHIDSRLEDDYRSWRTAFHQHEHASDERHHAGPPRRHRNPSPRHADAS